MATDLTTYSGLFFKKYAKKVITSYPPNAIIQAKVKVGEAERIGQDFNVPITLADEQGATYAVANSGAFALESAVDGELKSLLIKGANHVFRSNISYEAAASSLGNDTAADQTTGRVALSLRNNARKRIECDILYGQTDLGVVETAGSHYITITEATWSPALWVGMKNSWIDIFSSNLAATRPTGATSSKKVAAVDIANRKITLSTTIKDLAGAETTGTPETDVVATDRVFFRKQFIYDVSAPVHNSMKGLHAQLGNTGDHFGVSATTYEVVAGNVISAGSKRFDFDLAMRAVSRCQDMGSDAEQMVCLVSPLTWATLNTDLAANRRFDGSYTKTKGEQGNQTITYHSPLGDLDIVAHPLVKRGFAYGLAWEDLIRPGAYL